MNNPNNNNSSSNVHYPSMMLPEHEPSSSGEFSRIFDSMYHPYLPAHITPYSDYPSTSKLEAFEYTYRPPPTTHNILTTSANTVLDQIQTPPSSSSQTMETFLPISPVHLSQVNSSTAIAATHHHHHLHQHLYPPSSPPTCTDPSTWLGSGDYQSLHSTTNPSSYRHYSTPCSFYPSNNFYDSPPVQWTPAPPPAIIPFKFESPYSPPASYFDSSHCHNQGSENVLKKEQVDSPEQYNWHKERSLSASIPPRNPLNGKTRTRDKYRIVYTDQQRYELENEFCSSKYISIPRKSALSLTLALSERQIKIWFQNRRAKERKLTKKHRDASSTDQLNDSNDDDSPSNGGPETPTYYSTYS